MRPEPFTTDGPSLRSVAAFFLLTFALTTPFWILSAVARVELMPGLPLAGLAVVCPAAAALILSGRHGGARALLGRLVDAGRVRPRLWWAPVILLPPAMAAAAFVALRLGGTPVPDPSFQAPAVGALLAVFLVAGLAEELGWSGFAIGPLQARCGALVGALMVGAVWSLWHYPALVMAGRSLAWIGWWTLGTVAARVIMVWLFNNTGGSVFGAAVFHAMSNLSWQLFPVQGSWFDPRVNGLIAAGVAVVVVVAWGPRSLSSWGWRAGSGPAAGG